MVIIFKSRLCDLSRDRQAAFRILLSVGPQAPTRSRSGQESGRVFRPYALLRSGGWPVRFSAEYDAKMDSLRERVQGVETEAL